MLRYAITGILVVAAVLVLPIVFRKTRPLRDFSGELLLTGILLAALGVLTYFDQIPMYKPVLVISLFALSAAQIYMSLHHYLKRSVRHGNELVLKTMRSPVVIFDINSKAISINDAAFTAFELSQKDIGKLTMSSFFRDYLYKDTEDSIDEQDICLPDSFYQEHYYDVSDKSLVSEKGGYFGRVLIFREVTSVRLATKEVAFFATHDQLTGMLNRYGYKLEYQKFIRDARLPITVVFADINNLKLINDVYGTDVGDRMIRVLADSFSRITRGKKGLAVRTGGDEIMMLLPDTDEVEASTLDSTLREMAASASEDGRLMNIAVGYATQSDPEDLIEIVVNNANVNMYKNKLVSTESTYSRILESFKITLSQSNYETEQHASRMTDLARKFGMELNLKRAELDDLIMLAQLHDIGKISTPVELIQKPGKLTKDEWEIMKLHTTKGYKIASSHPALSAISHEIQCHHERWDGTGYPNGLEGEEIPRLARIISIVDSFDAMTNTRPYQNAISPQEAVEELLRCSGSQFDPDLVSVFIEVLKNEGLA